MKHNVLLKITVAVLCVLVVCTFLSRTVANAALVTVQAVQPVRSAITVTRQYGGTVRFAGDWTVAYYQPLTVTAVSVKRGDAVKKGQVLMTVNAGAFTLQLKQMDLAVLQLQDQIAAAAADGGALAELNLQLDIARTQEAQYMAANPTDGNVYAPAAGVVSDIIGAGSAVPGAALCEIYDPGSAASVVFTLSEQDGNTFAQDDGLGVILNTSQVMYDYTAGADQSTAVQQDSSISQRVFDANARTYDFYAPITGNGLYSGQSISVQLIQSSPAYDTVVPAAAVQKDPQTNGYYVYLIQQRGGLFGKENYVSRVNVDVQFSNNVNTAIKSNQIIAGYAEVAVSSSGLLTDGGTVKLADNGQ